jgi:P27 family predicted phage terminase small subunit
MRTNDKPPKDLSREARDLWRRIHDEMEVDAPALLLLDSVCQQFDRMMQARKILAKQGIIVEDKTAAGLTRLRAHPACTIEASAAAAMMRAWRLLGFDQAAPPGVA